MFQIVLQDTGERRFPKGSEHELFMCLDEQGNPDGEVHCACLTDDEDIEGLGFPSSRYMILKVV